MKIQTLFSNISFYKIFFIMGLFSVLFIFPKLIFAETFHSVQDGGNWNNTATWIENEIPTETDSVEINGIVSFNYSFDIQYIHINEGSALRESSSYPVEVNAVTVHVENNAEFSGNSLNLNISGDLYNYGEMLGYTITAQKNVYNYGTIDRMVISGAGEKELIGFEAVNRTEIKNDIILINDPYFKNLRLGNYNIDFNYNGGYIETSSISAYAEATIHGEVRIVGDSAYLGFEELSADKMIINTAASFDRDIIFHGDIHILENYSLSQNGSYSRSFNLDGNLEIDINAEFSSNNNVLNVYVERSLINNGYIHSMRLHSSGDIENNGTIEFVFLTGTTERGLSGFEDVAKAYISDDIILNTNVSFGAVVFQDNHSLNFTENADTITLTNTVAGDIKTNGNIVVDGHINLTSTNIHAKLFTIPEASSVSYNYTIHFYSPVIMKNGSHFVRSSSNNTIIVYFHKDLLVESDVEYLTHTSRPMTYVAGNIDFQAQTTARFYLHNDEGAEPYDFRYGYTAETLFGNQDLGVQNKIDTVHIDGIYTNIAQLLTSRQKLYWQSKSETSDWSQIKTLNTVLYLEENLNFFSVTNIQDTLENKGQELTISAADSNYTGNIHMLFSIGSISPDVIYMENGIATVNVSFDTPQENVQIAFESQSHQNLAGKSNVFNILHTTQNTFFTTPAILEVRQGTELIIPVTASEVDYTGDVIITYIYLDDTGISKQIILPNMYMQNGQATFSYTLEYITSESYFSFQDKDKDYLKGQTNNFFIKKKKRKSGSTSHTVSETFLSQGGDESDQDTEPETENPVEIDVQENEGEEIDEPKYLLENTCLDIHSRYQSLSKSRRTVLNQNVEEKQNVKNLQQKLKDLNFLNGSIDGDYGNNTRQAVKDFQRQNDLYVDGIFGNSSSNYIDVHCDDLRGKVTQETEEVDVLSEEEGSVEGEVDDGGGWVDDIGNAISSAWNTFWNFFGGNQDDDEISDEQNQEVSSQEPVSLLFERSDGTILEIPYTELYDVETNIFSDPYSIVNYFDINKKSSGQCQDKSNPACTSLDKIRTDTLLGVIDLKNNCNCNLVITGGTEEHKYRGIKSHGNGWKLDYKIIPKLDLWIESLPKTNYRTDGDDYTNTYGDIHTKEMYGDPHWDVVYNINYTFKDFKYK